MAKSKKPAYLKAEASAKAEVVAKATYKRTRSTTEIIPPDVTRAKAGAWLDVISPITQWAGLIGDKLRSKRELFRVQQEETLLRVAQEVRLRIDGKVIKTVPSKILVPALERASLEDPSDDAMIRRWAELLASASQELSVQPRFVSILGELAGSQAECLDSVTFNNFNEYNFPASELSGVPYDFAEHAYRRTIERQVTEYAEDGSDLEDLADRVAKGLNRPGVLPEFIIVQILQSEEWFDYDSVNRTGIRRERDLSILESLGLVRRAAIEFTVSSLVEVSIYYHHVTQLGVAFCEICSGEGMSKLEKKDAASRELKLERDVREL